MAHAVVDVRMADYEPVKNIIAVAFELAKAVETHLSPYTRESLIGTEAAMADALSEFVRVAREAGGPSNTQS